MTLSLFWASCWFATALSAPFSDLQTRITAPSCIYDTKGAICEPVNDAPGKPIGDHIGINLLATGVYNSTGIATKLRSKRTGKTTLLHWNQRRPDGTENGDTYFSIVTSHNGGIFYGDVGKAFAGEGQFPCSLFDDNPGGQTEFEWLLTHYYGERCRYNETLFCVPLLFDVPPFSGSKTILLKDNAEVCGR